MSAGASRLISAGEAGCAEARGCEQAFRADRKRIVLAGRGVEREPAPTCWNGLKAAGNMREDPGCAAQPPAEASGRCEDGASGREVAIKWSDGVRA